MDYRIGGDYPGGQSQLFPSRFSLVGSRIFKMLLLLRSMEGGGAPVGRGWVEQSALSAKFGVIHQYEPDERDNSEPWYLF